MRFVCSRAIWPAVLLLGSLARPAHALPVFSREYNVGCQTCHSIAPRLNQFGLAFQANHFNWPGGPSPERKGWLRRFPVSGIATASLDNDRTVHHTTTEFRTLDLFLADGFAVGADRPGGYFLDVVAVNTADQREGALRDAFISVPVAGKRGQLAVTVGQFSPVMYQYDLVNTLTSTLPSALSLPVQLTHAVAGSSGGGGGGGGGGYSPGRVRTTAFEPGGSPLEFSLISPMPGVRAEYFDGRGKGSADGNYVELGVPFVGQFAFNRDAELGHGLGLYAHGFHRTGYTTYGSFAYTEAGTHLEGFMGTYELRRNLYLLGIGTLGHDRLGSTRRLTLEAEYVATPRVAFTGRLEVIGGEHNDVAPVAAITFYPLTSSQALRLSGEAREFKGDRQFFLFARGQF